MGTWGYSKLLANKDVLFCDQSYDEALFEAAAYQIRISTHELLVDGKYYAEYPGDCVFVPPGQSAFLSSVEIVSLPFDVEARVVLRYSYGVKGLSMILGGHVDPLYEGRIFLILQNVTDQPIPLMLGYPIAKLAFSTVEYEAPSGCSAEEEVKAKFTREPKVKLSGDVLNWRDRVTSQLAAVLDGHSKDIEGFRAITQYVLFGGVFVVAITVLSAVLQTIFGAWNSTLGIGGVISGSSSVPWIAWVLLLLVPIATTFMFLVFFLILLMLLIGRLRRR